jgi:uncharacterized protein YggU (UPF0235/DUF167 family)
VRIEVVVKTGSSRNDISIENNVYTVRLRSKPIENSANIELINLLSKYFGIPKTSITILKGLKSRFKLVEIGREDTNQKKK